MDKMNKNEFYNEIDSKFLYLLGVKNQNLSLKMDFSSKWSQKMLRMITKIASTRKEKLHIRNEFYNEFHFCCFICSLVQISL